VASHVVNLDLPWNPAVLAQRIARVHRLGQREAVNVVLLVSEGSFEERMEGTLDAKRALFAAAVGDDAETVAIERSSMARRIATLLGGEFAASTGKPAAPRGPTPDPVADLRERAGDALAQVVRLPDGRVVGVVRGDAPPVACEGPALVPARALEALGVLGSASPFAGAEVLYRAAEAADDAPSAARRELVTVAGRKRAAGDALAAAGQPAEALGLYREAMAFACRSLDSRGDPGAEPAALWAAIHGHLVPAGALSESDAGAFARAGEVARAFASVAVAPPAALVVAVAADASGLVAKVRASLLQ
jgi:Helicase conserved C-terminal domain